MAGIFDALDTGRTALVAQQIGLQTTGHNISNAATEGYHRQRVFFEANSGFGKGVRATGVRRAEASFLARQIGVQAGNYGRSHSRSSALTRLEQAVGGLGEFSLSSYLDRFFSSWRELAAAPYDEFQRIGTVSSSVELAGSIRRTAEQFKQAQHDADNELVARVKEANSLIKQLGEVNGEIMRDESYGTAANELRDKRALLVKDLGELVGVSSFTNEQGSLVVTLSGGLGLVNGVQTQLLEVRKELSDGFHEVYVDGVSNFSARNQIGSGRIKGLLEVRDNEFATRLSELDTVAHSLVAEANAIHSSNYDKDGTLGGELFEAITDVSGAASVIAIKSEISNDPGKLAASSTSAGAPGNGTGAQSMADLENGQVINNETLSASIAGLFTNLGYDVSEADQSYKRNGERMQQLEGLQESITGVSIEEEMVQLARFQRAFQAASKIISVVDEMLATLVKA